MKLFSTILSGLAFLTHGAPVADLIQELPDFGKTPTPQYSGYLDASAEEDGTMLHYWFATSTKGLDAPVVLWLNGGPGSSSLLGMLQEHGPLLINATGGLIENPYTWAQHANLLILEAPGGVGFSYCKAMLSGGSCHNTDISTAKANRAAVQDFFVKFPELKKNPFYITGESYAGVYVPTLSKELLDNAKEVNFRGLAVGDPCTDNVAQHDSMDMLWYGHKNGFVPDAEFDFLWNNCSVRVPHPIARGLYGAEDKWDWKAYTGSDAPSCRVAHRLFLMSTSKGFSQSWAQAWINNLSLFGPAAVVSFGQPGSLNYMQAAYLMREDVKKALHVTESPAKTWPGPAPGWTYESSYAACNGRAKPGTKSMIDFYREISPQLSVCIVFNGDTDPCVSYEGTRTAIERVGFKQIEGGFYRPWFYNQTLSTAAFLRSKPLLFGPDLTIGQAGGVQFGGHIVSYEKNLTFLTVHGSGHMVPQFRPQAALKLIRVLTSGSADDFAPPFSSEDKLSSMSDVEYDAYLDQWTKRAQTAPYVPETP